MKPLPASVPSEHRCGGATCSHGLPLAHPCPAGLAARLPNVPLLLPTQPAQVALHLCGSERQACGLLVPAAQGAQDLWSGSVLPPRTLWQAQCPPHQSAAWGTNVQNCPWQNSQTLSMSLVEGQPLDSSVQAAGCACPLLLRCEAAAARVPGVPGPLLRWSSECLGTGARGGAPGMPLRAKTSHGRSLPPGP